MTDEGVRVVRQWLGSINALEEGMWNDVHLYVLHSQYFPLDSPQFGLDVTNYRQLGQVLFATVSKL